MTDDIGIDHIYISVSDMVASQRFYDVLMAALGFRKNMFVLDGEPHVQYFNRHFGYVIRPAKLAAVPGAAGLHHFCFRVASEADVRALSGALEKAGIDAAAPKIYPDYAPDYIATFFSDPDGHRLEVTNYRAERRERHDAWYKTIDCRSLDDVRARIDAVDRQIVALLAERAGFVSQAARFKKTVDDVKAPARVEHVIAKVRALAEEQGADPALVERVYRTMIAGFIQAEMKELKP